MVVLPFVKSGEKISEPGGGGIVKGVCTAPIHKPACMRSPCSISSAHVKIVELASPLRFEVSARRAFWLGGSAMLVSPCRHVCGEQGSIASCANFLNFSLPLHLLVLNRSPRIIRFS